MTCMHSSFSFELRMPSGATKCLPDDWSAAGRDGAWIRRVQCEAKSESSVFLNSQRGQPANNGDPSSKLPGRKTCYLRKYPTQSSPITWLDISPTLPQALPLSASASLSQPCHQAPRFSWIKEKMTKISNQISTHWLNVNSFDGS